MNIKPQSSEEFLDIRSHHFARVAVAIPRVHLANPMRNADEHMSLILDAYEKGVQYLLFPELSITGYSCGDDFHSQTLIGEALMAMHIVTEFTKEKDIIVTFGVPFPVHEHLYNAAVTVCNGEILAVVPKTYLPAYREFYEYRHFEAGRDAPSFQGSVTAYNLDEDGSKISIPFGTDIIVAPEASLLSIHTDICEDLWAPVPPGTIAAMNGAYILANLSASNITIGKSEYRKQLVVTSSAKNLAVQMYAAAGHGESTNDLSWDGEALIADRGYLVAQGERFSREPQLVIHDVDLMALRLDRMKQNSFRECGADYERKMRWYRPSDTDNGSRDETCYYSFVRNIDPHPFVPIDQDTRDERCQETFSIQSAGLIGYLESLPGYLQRPLVAVSGGQDSTLAALVMADALDRMGLPRSHGRALTMPGGGTTPKTRSNAELLAEALGFTFIEIPIHDQMESVFSSIGYSYDDDEDENKLVYQNVQAWLRKLTEFAVVCGNGIDVGTGDLSENFLGWATFAADHISHYNVNADVPKTLVTYLIQWVRDVKFKDEPQVQEVLTSILDTIISPELLPPEDDEIVQSTEDLNGPYELHDFFAYYFLRMGFDPSRIVRMALHAFDDKYSLAEIKKWARQSLTMFFRSQIKRSVAPLGPKVGLMTVSPRGDLRRATEAQINIWIDEIEQIPDEIEEPVS